MGAEEVAVSSKITVKIEGQTIVTTRAKARKLMESLRHELGEDVQHHPVIPFQPNEVYRRDGPLPYWLRPVICST